MTNDEKCASCRFWLVDPPPEDGEYGICRRYPPKSYEGLDELDDGERRSLYGVGSVYPETVCDMWCGEWSQKSP